MKTLFIEPGSPWENGYIESFTQQTHGAGLLEGKILTEELASFMGAGQSEARACVEVANRDRAAPELPYEPPAASSMSGSRPDSRQFWQRWRMAAVSASGLRARSSTMSARDFVPPA